MEKDLFVSKATNDAFNAWANPAMPPTTYHPCDDERFYNFVHQFYKNEESGKLNEEDFVATTSAICPVPNAEDIFTDYCRRANAILGYLHYFNIKD